MSNIQRRKGIIGILTGGGDVPGLNPAIRAVTVRALREGYQVVGIRRGWAGLINMTQQSRAHRGHLHPHLTHQPHVGKKG